MNEAKINFAELAWDESLVGARSKTAIRESRKLRLVEFTSEFVEQDWCIKGHLGYVLDGELEITFSDRIERFAAGDGMIIVGGADERHKAKVIGSVVRLILAEEI
jgi:hypothetical protein